ncbi:low molecular weight phosphotyrosine protein phosphatase [Sinimarinibacterium sp. CAU 1509]|uniref:low molecular weight protein-tyrosine-phosphatase n=1 Tax=Sinimarinibacterium sp. CAU 1509 TaxID=2562283 RepID=UPI0010AD47B2|nr:low molecular weight protein-tyrosine-phosphatase [Sinimarinibacterium sp. CAU 1509]TJY56771.1 low molecular weight phosphotyrosine protein phosphatase [Sinimarinibacterium sp. CAU 1509]
MLSRILIVCTGNICRSPMAEALMRARVKDRAEQVQSAGTGALVGHPADPDAVAVAAEHGLDLSAHRAQQASAPLLAAMDLILTLDQSHSDWLNRQYPQLRGRVHKLLKWQNNADIMDPYRQPRAAFVRAFEEIELGVEDWLARL